MKQKFKNENFKNKNIFHLNKMFGCSLPQNFFKNFIDIIISTLPPFLKFCFFILT